MVAVVVVVLPVQVVAVVALLAAWAVEWAALVVLLRPAADVVVPQTPFPRTVALS